MNLEIINNLVNATKENKAVQSFTKELSNYLQKQIEGSENNMILKKKKSENDLKVEDCLYQVVDRSKDGVYLQNLKSNKVSEETSIPKELLDKIGNDYILRYKNGEYIFEEELTDDFFSGLADIDEIINKQ